MDRKLRRRRERLGMRIVVDLTRCQGYAQCVFLAPEVFELHGEEALIYNPAVPDDQLERVRQAAAACPVQAIVVGEEVTVSAR
jgi:ferredoxin